MATSKRCILTIQQRLDVLEELKTLPISTVAAKYKVHPMTIRRISYNASNISQIAGKNKHNKRLRKAIYKELEDELMAWYKYRRTLGDTVSDSSLLKRATEINSTMRLYPKFKPSKDWLLRFKYRNHIGSYEAEISANNVTFVGVQSSIKDETLNIGEVINENENIDSSEETIDNNEERNGSIIIENDLTDGRYEGYGVFYNEEEKEDLEHIFKRLEYYISRVEPSTQLHVRALRLKFLGDLNS